MSWALYAILAVPLAAVLLTLVDGWRLARAATLVAGLVSLGAGDRDRDHGRATAACSTRADGWLRLDSLGAVFLLATGLLYAMAGVFSIGYLGVERDAARASPRFAQALLRAAEPVRLDDAAGAARRRLRDAVGRGRADDDHLRAAGRDRPHRRRARGVVEVRADRLQRPRDRAAVDHRAVRDRHPRARQRLHPAVHALPRARARRSRRTRCGSRSCCRSSGSAPRSGSCRCTPGCPTRTARRRRRSRRCCPGRCWRPRSTRSCGSSRSPSPTASGAFAEHVLIVFGAISLVAASFFVLRQGNFKRLLAYSSIEHMGIIALGIGFGAPLAVAGALLHVITHASAKGLAFFGTGSLLRGYDTKEVDGVTDAGRRDAVDRADVPGRRAGALRAAALRRVPQRVRDRRPAASREPQYVGVTMLLVFVNLAFFGIIWHTGRMVLSAGRRAHGGPSGERDRTVVARAQRLDDRRDARLPVRRRRARRSPARRALRAARQRRAIGWRRRRA